MERSAEHQAFIKAARHCVEVFNQPKHKRELKRMSPRFWASLLDLDLVCDSNDWSELSEAFKGIYKQLGAPGDFGYGYPTGDALKDLYNAWNALCKTHASKEEPATAS